MAIILHFGAHKTGSSSIQNALANHKLGDGWTYIKFGSPNSSSVTKAAYNLRKPPADGFSRLFEPEDDLNTRRRKIRREVRQKLSQLTGSDSCVFSAEAAVGLLANELKRFQLDCARTGHDVRAVGYIRDPESYFSSAYQQILKARFVPIEKPAMDARYIKMFRKFHRTFGPNNTDIWRFNPKAFPQNDVVLDFCERLGINLQDYKATRKNESLSSDALKLLYVYRMKYRERHKQDVHLVNYLLSFPGRKFKFSADLIRANTDVTAKDFEWLRKHHKIDFSDVWPPKGDGLSDPSEFYDISHEAIQKLSEDISVSIHGNVRSNSELIADSLKQYAMTRAEAKPLA